MEEPKKPFKLSKVNWIFALILIGISASTFLIKDGVNGYSIGYIIGSIATIGLIPLFFSYIAWLIRGKKLYAGSYTFNVFLVLIFMGMLGELGTISKENEEIVNEITNSAAEYREKLNSEEDPISALQEHSSNLDAGLAKMIKNSTGNEQEVFKNLQKFNRINSSVILKWQKSFDSILEPRILDYSVLDNQTEVIYQIGVLEYYKKQSEEYKDHFENRKSLIDDLNRGIPDTNRALQGIKIGINKKDSVQKPIFKLFINSHINYSQHLIEIVKFLDVNMGKWVYQNDELIFDNYNLEEKYSEIIQKVSEDEIQINELSDKLFELTLN